MAFLDFIKNRGAAPEQSQQAPAAQTQQQEAPSQRSVESLPGNVKAEAVEAARPAAELMDKATTARTGESQTQPSMQNTPDNTPARGRGLAKHEFQTVEVDLPAFSADLGEDLKQLCLLVDFDVVGTQIKAFRLRGNGGLIVDFLGGAHNYSLKPIAIES